MLKKTSSKLNDHSPIVSTLGDSMLEDVEEHANNNFFGDN